MSDEEWIWRFRPPAKHTYENLDEYVQRQIAEKLDEIVTDWWRDPEDYLESMTDVPYSNLRVGNALLGIECNHDEHTLDIYSIERRGDSHTPGDA
jgi:mRNA interferase RelE/StbE